MKHVAAAIIIEDNRVLLTRRAPGQDLAGFWEFPGGKLEPGESAQACIVRELHEELGIAALAGEIFTRSVYEYTGGVITLIAVQAEILGGEISLTVHDAFEWVHPSELRGMKLAPADIPIAEELINRHE